MTADEIRDAVRHGILRFFHVDSDGWVGHGTSAEGCHQCARAVEAATDAIVDRFRLEETQP
jgi:hypothetical protein